MKKEEKELFWELCRFMKNDPDRLMARLKAGHATPAVLGELFWNRMAGVAYGVLKENQGLSLVQREFRGALKNAYRQNIEKNKDFFACLRMLDKALQPCRGQYAMLKGAYLCKVYPTGYRTASDVDLLVESRHVTAVGRALERAGFAQGSIRNDRLIPAGRAEIVSSKMLRGETVPYIREVNLPQMTFLEVDINFSLDYKNGDDDRVSRMLSGARAVRLDDTSIVTLGREDFLIHLCEHLYKEATTYPWVKMKRDMTLYKYSDIAYLLSSLSADETAALIPRIHELRAEKACYYAILSSRELFAVDRPPIDSLLCALAPADRSFLDVVVDPANHRTWTYTEKDRIKRFWSRNRAALLEETP